MSRTGIAEASHRIALAGLFLYVVFAPHSVAASAIAIGIAGLGWVFRTVASGRLGLSRTRFDLIIVCLLVWTIASSLLSEEPLISIAKLKASWCVFIFYLVRAVVTRRTALLLVALLIVSGAAGALYSLYDIARGRGVVVAEVASTSPFSVVGVAPNDTIWRVGGKRVYSTGDIDDVLHSFPLNSVVSVSLISRGEHIERQGLQITPSMQTESVASGIISAGRSHRFRASGWTRHYETFAEVLQMIAQLGLGLALAHLRNHGFNKIFRLAVPATLLLVVGIVLTAMRTVLLAFISSAFVIAWRSTHLAARAIVTFALFFFLAFGAVVVWQTRAPTALLFGDDSSSLRSQVAQVGLSRILIHPLFGHGMDAMHKHWHEWGFPGNDMLHLHSTPLQLAFDRGLPALVFWWWLMMALWIYIARAEKRARNQSDTHSYGILLGILGALTGFLISSLVNYNYGDSEIVMLFWCLMGIAMVVGENRETV
ncbi:MAG TPA: O-antigen ligase family protein [Pyrinomonadaceae bacterium]|nr:O-antigen ligase family protein [Pyrinomonadaceae bacterium]